VTASVGFDDEWDDNDAGEDYGDHDVDSDADLMACPVCRAAVHEDTQQCPSCGDWIIPVYPAAGSRRWVWILAAALVIIALLVGVMR